MRERCLAKLLATSEIETNSVYAVFGPMVKKGSSQGLRRIRRVLSRVLLNHLQVLAHIDEDVDNEPRNRWQADCAVHSCDGTLPFGPY
jgi:hypothetical protein